MMNESKLSPRIISVFAILLLLPALCVRILSKAWELTVWLTTKLVAIPQELTVLLWQHVWGDDFDSQEIRRDVLMLLIVANLTKIFWYTGDFVALMLCRGRIELNEHLVPIALLIVVVWFISAGSTFCYLLWLYGYPLFVVVGSLTLRLVLTVWTQISHALSILTPAVTLFHNYILEGWTEAQEKLTRASKEL